MKKNIILSVFLPLVLLSWWGTASTSLAQTVAVQVNDPNRGTITVENMTTGQTETGAFALVDALPDEWVRITPNPNAGFYFQNWTGDIPEGSEQNDPVYVQQTVDGHSITANFRPLTQITVSAANPARGDVSITNQSTGDTDLGATAQVEAAEGDSILIEAVPNAGYFFQEWGGDIAGARDGDDPPSGSALSNPTSFTQGDENRTITANFGIRPRVTVSANDATRGEVTVENLTTGASETGGTASVEADEGDQIQITAAPDASYRFEEWTGDIPGGLENSNPASFTQGDENRSITASFGTRPRVTVISSDETRGDVTVENRTTGDSETGGTASVEAEEGDQIRVTADPEDLYRLAGWTGDIPGGLENANPATFEQGATSRSIVANFSRNPTITVSANDAAYGEVLIEEQIEGAWDVVDGPADEVFMGNVQDNAQIRLTALPFDDPDTPYEDHEFIRWVGDIPEAAADSARTIFTQPDGFGENRDIQAVFRPVPKERLIVNILPVGHENLDGVGVGTVHAEDMDTGQTEVYTPQINSHEWLAGATIRLTAQPGILTQGGVDFQSFVFEWGGDLREDKPGTTSLPHDDVISLSLRAAPDDDEEEENGNDEEPKAISILFSREYHPGEGVGDLDLDGLPDVWEIRHGLDPKDATGDDGATGNPSNDFMPGGWIPGDMNQFASGAYPDPADPDALDQLNTDWPYRFPVTGERPEDYYIGVIPFNNWFQARGFDGWYGVNPITGIDDRPGTDPNLVSTADGDSLSDGWKYYFYGSLINDEDLEGEALDVDGFDPDTSWDILAVPIPHEDMLGIFGAALQVDPSDDPDSDCLDLLDEFNSGTDPFHWDTDGDGISDGYEIRMGLNPLDATDAGDNDSGDHMALFEGDDGTVYRHDQVYAQLGFDPRTGWGENYLGRGSPRALESQMNTVGFTNFEHFLASLYLAHRQGSTLSCGNFGDYALNPRSIDSDGDGMFDGWELYVGLNPMDADDAGNRRASGLTNFQEFSCYDLDLIHGETWPNGRSHFDPQWRNKVWPTDPNNPDTSGDGISDGASGGYVAAPGLDLNFSIGDLSVLKYAGDVVSWNGDAYIGGGLNPTSVDTSGDRIPDHWQALFRSSVYDMDDLENRDGMDPTLKDADRDYSGNGLANYQEYLVGAVHHWRYRPDWPIFSDGLPPGMPLGSHDPMVFFTGEPYEWDWNHTITGDNPFYFIEHIEHRYNSTDPRMVDTDQDGMDDYWKIYHGLNPTYGHRDLFLSMYVDADVGTVLQPPTFDIRVMPHVAGHPLADPDQDGLPNYVESIRADDGPPFYHHTDPSPLWVTDTSYQRSWVNLYYAWNPAQPWYWDEAVLEGAADPPTYMFSFAVNEGFDTDGDFIGDRAEIVDTPESPGVSDPLSVETPSRRAALFLEGESAARTRRMFIHESNYLRTFTVEAWVRPKTPASGAMQVVMERPIDIPLGNIDGLPKGVRLNFRLALDGDGIPFVAYNGAGSDVLYVEAKASSQAALQPDEWVHLAGVYDGEAGQLRLYVNGDLRQTTASNERPFNGWMSGADLLRVQPAPLVIGAEDHNPDGWVTGTPVLVGPDAGYMHSQPDLDHHFEGWVDEVRVWGGARSHEEIVETMGATLRMQDVEATLDTPTRLFYLYNFNSLHDPIVERVAPDGFDLLSGRPDDGSYPHVAWWANADHRSDLYDNYHYVPWIPNIAARLPLDPPADSPSSRLEPVVETEWVEETTVVEEVDEETGETIQVEVVTTNEVVTVITEASDFPNTANPYNLAYYHAPTAGGERHPDVFSSATYGFDTRDASLFNDLLPLGQARADIAVDMWDGFGEGGFNRDTRHGTDSNNDGLPDWWYLEYGLDPDGDSVAEENWDGTGLSNYWQYRLGADPHNPYSLWEQAGRVGDPLDDGEFDSSGDGLSNREKIDKNLNPLVTDTDDDGIDDVDEIAAGTDPLNPYDPLVYRAVEFEGSSRLRVGQDGFQEILNGWTLEAWVRPAQGDVSGVILRRKEADGGAETRVVNYELGVEDGVPYVRYVKRSPAAGGEEIRVNALEAIDGDVWTHLAAVRDPEDGQLRLFVDGKRVNYKLPTPRVSAAAGVRAFETTIGGGDLAADGTAEEGFEGALNAVRVWNYARTGYDIQEGRGVLLPEFLDRTTPDLVRAPVQIFNFDDGGDTYQNFFHPEDWLSGWVHAATADSSDDVTLFETPFPPLNYDRDDDGVPDVVERGANTDELRSESPYIPRMLTFDGTDGVVQVDGLVDSTKTQFYGLEEWTIETWVRPRDYPVGRTPLISRRTDNEDLITFELGLKYDAAEDRLTPYAAFHRDDSGNELGELNGSASVGVDKWIHLAATRDEDGVFTLYVDGEQVARRSLGAAPFTGTNGALEFGAPGFEGDMMDMRIWDSPRTGQQIGNDYRSNLLFTTAMLANSFDGSFGTHMGRQTVPVEDGIALALVEGVPWLEDEPRYRERLVHQFGLTAWVKLEPGSEGGSVISRLRDMGMGDEIDLRAIPELRITGDGRPQGYWQGQVTVVEDGEFREETRDRSVTSEVDVRSGEWVHLALIGDGERVRLYIDGMLDLDTSYYRFGALDDGREIRYRLYRPFESVLRIGDGGFDGVIDEVSIWNVNRTQEEVRQIMEYGLSPADVRRGVEPIRPLPAGAIDPGEPRQALVSYVTVDGELDMPFVPDLTTDDRPYRILPVPHGEEIVTDSTPPIVTDNLRVFDGALRGFFAAADGGATLENYMQRNDYGYAGLLIGGVEFTEFDDINDPIIHQVQDSNNDGIPDWWYVQYAQDPAGPSVAGEDWSGNGLVNLFEYKAGLDPYAFDSFGDGVSDYDSIAPGTGLTFGEIFDDGDGLPYSWEAQFEGDPDPYRFDAFDDPDQDGWDNLSEYLAGTNPADSSDMPQPTVHVRVDWDGTEPDEVRWIAWNRPEMDGHPIARGRIADPDPIVVEVEDEDNGDENGEPEEEIVERAPIGDRIMEVTSGALTQGENYILFFADLDDSGEWSEGEPAGFPDDMPVDIGWGDVYGVRVGLTTDPVGYFRFFWEPEEGRNSHMIRLRLAGSSIIFERKIVGRNYVHEYDMKDLGGANTYSAMPFDLPSGTSASVGYQWQVHGEWQDEQVIKDWTQALSAPSVLSPEGTTRFAGQPFRWQPPASGKASRYIIEIRRSSDNAVVWTDTIAAPVPGPLGEVRYRLPISVGMPPLESGGYKWRVRAQNPTGSGDWSAPANFQVDTTSRSSGPFEISGELWYMGRADVTKADFLIQAFRSPSMVGRPIQQTVLREAGVWRLAGLPEGTYYVRAFMDVDGDGQYDYWEPYSFLRSPTPYAEMYTVKPVSVGPNSSRHKIIVRDVDTDNDGFSDAWEWQTYFNLDTVDASYRGQQSRHSTEIGTAIPEMLPTDLTLDSDGDGVPDVMEIILGYDPNDPTDTPPSNTLLEITSFNKSWVWFGLNSALGTSAEIDRRIGVQLQYSTNMVTWRDVPTARKEVEGGGGWRVFPGGTSTGPMVIYRLRWYPLVP